MFTENEVAAMRGAAAVDAAGAKIGTVGDVYLDDASGQPAWATVESGLFRTRVRFVPLGGASMDGRRLKLPFTKDAVLTAPRVAEDEHLSAEEEAALYGHYGVDRPAGPPDAATPDVAPSDAATPDAATPDAAASEQAGTIRVPAAPAPAPAQADDAALREALDATVSAHEAARQADPIGDGSYAGDSTKASLVNTADLEAYDHRPTSEVAHGRPVAAPSASHIVEAAPDPAGTDLPEGVDPADVAASDRAAEARSLAAENRWAVAQGRPVDNHEDDL